MSPRVKTIGCCTHPGHPDVWGDQGSESPLQFLRIPLSGEAETHDLSEGVDPGISATSGPGYDSAAAQSCQDCLELALNRAS